MWDVELIDISTFLGMIYMLFKYIIYGIIFCLLLKHTFHHNLSQKEEKWCCGHQSTMTWHVTTNLKHIFSFEENIFLVIISQLWYYIYEIQQHKGLHDLWNVNALIWLICKQAKWQAVADIIPVIRYSNNYFTLVSR